MKLTINFLEQALVDQYNMYHLNIEYQKLEQDVYIPITVKM